MMITPVISRDDTVRIDRRIIGICGPNYPMTEMILIPWRQVVSRGFPFALR
jgi:hypothetical protein